jgi:hypothetical protein
VNNRDKNYTVAKVIGRMEQVDASIARYLRALERADREESDIAEAKSVRLKEKIAGLRRQMQALKMMERMVQDAPDQQVSLTDPDARSMATSGKGTATEPNRPDRSGLSRLSGRTSSWSACSENLPPQAEYGMQVSTPLHYRVCSPKSFR